MKKISALISLSVMLISACATTGQDISQTVPLDEAIREGAEHIESTLETGAKVALLNFGSPSAAFSAYVLDELSDHFVNGRKVIVVDRSELELIRKEEKFQLSGEVSDATAVSIGQKVGAQIIVSGSLVGIGRIYRVRIRVLDVETAVITASRSSDINPREERVRALLGRQTPVVETPPQTLQRPTQTQPAASGINATPAPGSAEDYLAKGKMFLGRNDYDNALLELNEAIKLRRNFAEAYLLRGRAYTGKGDKNKAMADYNQAIRIDSNNMDAYLHRGRAYEGRKDYDKAIADYNHVIRNKPNDTAGYSDRARIYMEKRDYSRAIDDYTQILHINPNSVWYSARASAYERILNHKQAIADYTKAIEANPNNANLYSSRGDIYYETSDYERAIADYETMIRLDPSKNFSWIKERLVYSRQRLQNR